MSGGSSPIHPISIGTVHLENNLALAPMAGVTDPPFRRLCKEQGAGLVCMEMVSAKAIFYKNRKTDALLRIYEDERPVSLQLFGSDADCMADMAAMLTAPGSPYGPFDLLDINMGCPVPKIVKNGEGSALMTDPPLAEKIISKVAEASEIPVTVKIRAGFREGEKNAPEFARRCEAAGAQMIAVHGRTREQYYSGQADWEIIGKVKQAVEVPVFGNGDLTGFLDIRRMYEMTGVDGFMIARAAQGNPWIFSEILYEAEHGGAKARPSRREVISMILRHARALIEEKTELVAMREMRKHATWYIAGFHGAAALRREINTVENIEELETVLSKIGNN